jgi:hypothetical protein
MNYDIGMLAHISIGNVFTLIGTELQGLELAGKLDQLAQ